MKRFVENMQFDDRPVKTASLPPGVVTNGIFTKAAEIRGLDRICIDPYEDSIFVKELLGTITELTIERIKCWHRLADIARTFPLDETLIMADDSLTMISAEHYEQVEAAIRSLLNDEVKQRAKVWLLGYVPKDTSLANIEFFYKCAKRRGHIKRN